MSENAVWVWIVTAVLMSLLACAGLGWRAMDNSVQLKRACIDAGGVMINYDVCTWSKGEPNAETR